MTYGKLKSDIARFMHRTDLTADIPTLVELASADIRETLRSMLNQSATQITETERLVPEQGTYALPDDFLEVSGLQIVVPGGAFELQAVGQGDLVRFASSSGIPVVYAINAGVITFAPTPLQGQVFDLIYFTDPAPFVDDADTNDILENQPGLYLYLAMYHGHTLAQDHQQADIVNSKAQAVMARMNMQADRARYGAAPIQTGDYNFNSSSSWGSF